MKDLIKQIKEQLKGKTLKIVFTEGHDVRVQRAAFALAKDKIITPILLGDTKKITTDFKECQLSIKGIKLIDDFKNFPKFNEMKDLMLELRKGKMSEEEVINSLGKANYFGTMLVKIGYADGLLGGATYSTADTVRPALQLIKAKDGEKLISSSFLMIGKKQKFVFSDCALNLFPTAEELGSITKQTVATAKIFGLDPKVALLSYSTKGSGKGEAADKVRNAYELLTKENVDFQIDGELQVDAALVANVAKLKAPQSNVAGNANVLIFPDINAGNIGYKLVERLGGYEALGPILQGLAAPICDLSRGCSETDIYKMAYITALQKVMQ